MNGNSVYGRLANPLLCIVLGVLILYYGQSVLKPLALSALLAILLTTPCRYFEKQGFPRGLSSLISLLIAIVVFFIVFFVLAKAIISFREDLPQMQDSINASIKQLEKWTQNWLNISQQQVKELMDSSTDTVVPKTSYIVNTALTTVSTVIFITILIIIQTFLLLLYRGMVVNFFINLFEKQYSTTIYEMFVRMRYVIRSYIGGLFIEMVIIAAANCTVMFLLGVKYALLLGVIAAILNIIPYLGIFIALVLSSLITLTTNSPTTVLWMIGCLLVVHMLDSNVLMPRIMGSKVKINALATIVGVIIGTTLWGIPGTFLAVPIMAIIKMVFEAVPEFRPFAILMDDEVQENSISGPVLKKIRARVARSVKK